MDILKRTLAPITTEAWKEIDDWAQTVLKGNLSARSLVDFNGPHGWAHSAVNLGSVRFQPHTQDKGIQWGQRKALPLVEIRIPFTLNISDLDNVTRGSKTPDLDTLEKAAQKAASFEETAVYLGFEKGGIEGIANASPHKSLKLAKSAKNYQDVIEAAVVTLQKAGIGGPYQLVLGTEPFRALLQGDESSYPLIKRVLILLNGGEVNWSPALKGGVLFSSREGNYELTVGQDLSIGYAGTAGDSVELFIAESFTFRVLEPRAGIELKFGGS
jgi:uncharacterized linocin/CFP29 family protein